MYQISSTKTTKLVYGDINFINIDDDETEKDCEEYCKNLNLQKKEIDYYSSNGLKRIYEEARNFEYPENKSIKINKGGLKMYDIIKEFPELGEYKTFFDKYF